MIVRADDLQAAQQMTEWDASWRIMMLTDSPYQSMCGKGERGAYTIKLSRHKSNWRMRIGDFIGYAQAENINALVLLSQEEWDETERFYRGHAFNEPFLREDEPEVLIHSTPFANWTKIKRDGCLKSWNRVKQEMETQEEKPIGHLLGDPEDFRDYIMFGTGERCEIVVSSKEAGRLVDDADEAYHSGARMYFDARKMAADGLLIRDGTHLKVKHGLPLQPYMIWAATWENLGLDSPISTPKRFSHTADSMFEENFHRSAK